MVGPRLDHELRRSHAYGRHVTIGIADGDAHVGAVAGRESQLVQEAQQSDRVELRGRRNVFAA